jgi:hypothetical protein
MDGCEHVNQLVEALGEQVKLEEDGLKGRDMRDCFVNIGTFLLCPLSVLLQLQMLAVVLELLLCNASLLLHICTCL